MSFFEEGDNAFMLNVRTQSGVKHRYKFIEGTTLIVGQGQNCGLRLEGESIAPMHCVLRLSGGTLTVQDWCSNTGTFVGETRVTDETEVALGAVIRAGEYEIVAESPEMPFSNAPSGEIQNEDEVETSVEETLIEETAVDEDEGDSLEAEPSCDDMVVSDDLESEAMTAARESCGVGQWEPAETADRQTADRPDRRATAISCDEETNALLQEEIELLQSELAERDAQIQELTALLETSAEPVPAPDTAEMDNLMTRLEQLLDELGQGDQRIRSLEELLRAAQQANQAEQEERQQIEKWLNDIEGRLAERESEWLAEREVLLVRLDKQREQRDELFQQLDKATAAVPAPEVPRGALRKLQKQIDELQEQLHETDEKRRRAEERVEVCEHQLSQSSYEEQVEAAVREERLKLAQERAGLSRTRAELTRHANDHCDSPHDDRVREADERFRAFRDTLRELHQQETAPAVRKAGLGSRLAEIWRRLDGPTDTD